MTADQAIDLVRFNQRHGVSSECEAALVDEVVRLRARLLQCNAAADSWLSRDNSDNDGDYEWSEEERIAYRCGLDASDVCCAEELKCILRGET